MPVKHDMETIRAKSDRKIAAEKVPRDSADQERSRPPVCGCEASV
jgi:hypothetical protein